MFHYSTSSRGELRNNATVNIVVLDIMANTKDLLNVVIVDMMVEINKN